VQSRRSRALEVIVFDAHIPLVPTVADLTPLQKTWLIACNNRRVEAMK
jgi:hypothetical protein